MPDGVLLIASYACISRTGLVSVVMADSVAVIENHAFYRCAALVNFQFGEGLRQMGDRAFEKCTQLDRLMFPPDLQQVGLAAFDSVTCPLYFKGPSPVFKQVNPSWPLVYYCANRTGWPSYPAPKTIWTTVAAFYAMGGTPTYASHTYNVGNPYGALPSASKSDFAFRGWWMAPGGLGLHVYTNSLVPYITSPHSLYADWALYPAIGG